MNKDIKVGDTVVVTKGNTSRISGRTFFKEGDIAVISNIDADGDLWGDFNCEHNENIYSDGIWCITERGSCELAKV